MKPTKENVLTGALQLPAADREEMIGRLTDSLIEAETLRGRELVDRLRELKLSGGDYLPLLRRLRHLIRANDSETVAADLEAANKVYEEVDTSLDEGFKALRDASLPREDW